MPTIALSERACPICASTEYSRLFAESNTDVALLDGFAFASRKLPEYMHWRLMECQRCDMVYSSPAPSLEDLATFYRDAAFGSSVEAQMASRTYGQILRRYIPRLPDTVAAADIGAGDGTFLCELLNAGFQNVVGIEPSAAPIATADERIRPLLRQDIFRPESFPRESLSLITCFQTIEHIADPLAFCRDAWRALKPGGAIFMIGHNRRAFSARVLGRKSPIFDIEHMQLFTPASGHVLLDAAGFTEIEVAPIHNRYPLRYWAQLFPFPRSMKQPLLTTLSAIRVGAVNVPLPAGNMAMFGVKRSRL